MDDGPDNESKRQKQAQEDEDADADLSICLDSPMDVLKHKKTNALADFANKDEDQPIAKLVFPSLINSEEEIDKLVNDDANFREATPFNLEEKDTMNMSFEMQGVWESSPQRPSFITEEDHEDALMESQKNHLYYLPRTYKLKWDRGHMYWKTNVETGYKGIHQSYQISKEGPGYQRYLVALVCGLCDIKPRVLSWMLLSHEP